MKNSESARKRAEGFVSWTDKPRSEGQGGSVSKRSTLSSRVVLKKGTSNSSSCEPLAGRRVLDTNNGKKLTTSAVSLEGSERRSQRDQGTHYQNLGMDRANVGKGATVLSVSRSSQASMQKSEGTRPSDSQVQRQESSGLQKSVGIFSTRAGLNVSGEDGSESLVRQSLFSKDQQGTQIEKADSIPSSECNHFRGKSTMRLSSSKPRSHLSERHFIDGASMHRENSSKEASEEDDVQLGEMRQRPSPCNYGKEKELFPFANEDETDDGVTESENEGHALLRVDEPDGEEMDMAVDMKVLTSKEESTRRSERRRAKTMWLKEGEKRKKKGKPRNYLLVDDCTGKPYGIGVGAWRKELMLLSRELDPAIGNINQQPESVLIEIAEWIQHTWEYSAPLKFKIVKEVIARGVTLRRRELWRMIRNGEGKPEEVSDRTWRTLKRLLESAATIKKFEDCCKANASRVNLGRTGPSGEVGVRERLRKRLLRSPEPEEIRFEMARDKGYGGRSKRKFSDHNVMHGSESVRKRARKMSPVSVPTTEVDSVEDSEDVEEEERNTVNGAERLRKGRYEEGRGHGVLHLSAEDIAQHPFVLKMMERLDALEGRQSIATEVGSGLGILCVTAEQEQEKVRRDEEKDIVGRDEVDKRCSEVGLRVDRRMSGRLRKKAEPQK